MSTTFPGTTIEVLKIEKNSSRTMFKGIFTTGGITLSQVCIMTGLEPYMIQNWVKRGFLTSPKGRVYSKEQFSRIIIINALKDVLQIDKICRLIEAIAGVPYDTSDDLISDDELYHRYVDMIADGDIDITDEPAVIKATESATLDFEEREPGQRKKLAKILQVMLYAHEASEFAKRSNDIISSLD